MEKLKLSGRLIGPDEPPFVIAEIGSNHNGDIALAKRLIDAAVDCGVDAVKFQSWSRSSLISKAEFDRHPVYSDKKKHFGSLAEMVEEYQLTPEQHHEVADYCRDRGTLFMSSCFSPEEVDLLDQLDVAALKIASMDVNHLPLLKHVASTHRPVLLSIGMATMGEIEQALAVLRDNGSGPVCILHCVAIYPPPEMSMVNLRNIATLARAFDVPVGFSDHTVGVSIPLAAIALGACIIEKHFTLDKEMEGWDHAISANPDELRMIVKEGRNVFDAFGSSVRTVHPLELAKRLAFRRRVVIRHEMKQGEKLRESDLDYKRPGTGIRPDETSYIIGRTLATDIEAEHELAWDDLE
jgi:N,N'-diacetyllegionaminate synthase